MDKVTGQCPQTTTFWKRKNGRSGIERRSFRLTACVDSCAEIECPFSGGNLTDFGRTCRKAMLGVCRTTHLLLLVVVSHRTERVPLHFQMSPRRFTVATMALLSAPENTHRALVVCESEWVSDCKYWTGQSAVGLYYPLKWLQRWLVAVDISGAAWNCCRIGASSVNTIATHQFTVSL